LELDSQPPRSIFDQPLQEVNLYVINSVEWRLKVGL
jgi:hypothetical protein